MYENNEFTGYMIDEASTVKDFDFSSVYRSKEFTECMKFFDTNHDMTRKVLLSVNEADQSIMMQALASKLYGHIVNKVDDIDFGTIPNSKGDITKIDKYEQLCDCINVLSEVLTNYNQPTDLVDTVSIALQNLVDRRDLFIKAYRLNADMPIMTYNTIALSVVSATSLLIASSIEFIKLPGNKGFDIAFDKTSKVKGKEKILYKNLSAFNKMCANDQFDKAMEFSIKNSMLLKSKKHEAADIQHEAVPGFAAISSAVGGSLGAASTITNSSNKVKILIQLKRRCTIERYLICLRNSQTLKTSLWINLSQKANILLTTLLSRVCLKNKKTKEKRVRLLKSRIELLSISLNYLMLLKSKSVLLKIRQVMI